MNLDGGNQRRLTREQEIAERPAWSPDGQTIAYQRAAPPKPVPKPRMDAVCMMHRDGGHQKQLTRYLLFHYGEPNLYDWSPDGQQIVFSGGSRCDDSYPLGGASVQFPPEHRRICQLDVESGTIMTLQDDSMDNWQPRWSPDGHRVAFPSRNPYSSATPTVLLILDLSTRCTYLAATNVQYMEWSPDGTKLAFSGNGIQIVDVPATVQQSQPD